MCNKISKLAFQNKYQWIGVCSHGSAHVFWRSVHICLPFDEFKQVMQSAQEGHLPVQPHGDHYLIWLNQLAIRINHQEYREMQQLFASAAEAKTGSMTNSQTITLEESRVFH